MEPYSTVAAEPARDETANPPPPGALWPLVLTVAVFAITAIPYAIGFLRPPPGMVFGGLLAWVEDEDMYFSFIRQAADGHFLFVNRLTGVDHAAVFFNPEWWLVGRIMAWLGDSGAWAFQIWRGAGALAVIVGFWALAEVVLRDGRQRRIALLMCAFGGGFWWITAVLERVDPSLMLTMSADLARGLELEMVSGTHPFYQILGNPHFALPLGLFLLTFAWYIRGELTGSPRWYALAAALAVLEGSMRPYDLIALDATIPLFLLIELAVTRELEIRRLLWRILPCVATVPLLLYFIYLFKYHYVFKYWGLQGQSIVIGVLPQLLSFGLAGLLVALRLCRAKAYPLRTPGERLLLAWLVTVFFFVHAHKIPLFHSTPYTFQLVSTIMPPIILLGVVVIDPALWGRSRAWVIIGPLLVAVFLAVNSLSSAKRVLNSATMMKTPNAYYIDREVLYSYKSINDNSSENDVVLCTRETGHALARYASVHVVVGHWSVSPRRADLDAQVERFYRGAMTPQESREFLGEWRVTRIYWGSNERKLGEPPREPIPGFEARVINPDIVLYTARREEGSRPGAVPR
jgi:hypothetical protein